LKRTALAIVAACSLLGCQALSGITDYGFDGTGAGGSGANGGGGAPGGSGGEGGSAFVPTVELVPNFSVHLGGGQNRAFDITGGTDSAALIVGEFRDTLLVSGTMTDANSTGGTTFDGYVVSATGPSPLQLLDKQLGQVDLSVTAVENLVDGTVIAGRYQGAQDLENMQPLAGPKGWFVARYDDMGALLWLRDFPVLGMTGTEGAVTDIEVTSDAVYFTAFADGLQVVLAPMVSVLTAGENGFVVALDIDAPGSYQSHQVFGGFGPQSATALTSRADGKLVVVGNYQTGLLSGGSTYVSEADNNGFAAVVNTNGGLLTSATVTFTGRIGNRSVEAVVSTDNNQVIIGGGFDGELAFQNIDPIDGGSGRNAFVATLSEVLAQVGHAVLTGSGAGEHNATGLAAHQNLGLSVVSVCPPTVTYGGFSSSGAGGNDVCIALFDDQYKLLSFNRFGDDKDQQPTAAIGSGGTGAVCGFFQGTIEFGPRQCNGGFFGSRCIQPLDTLHNRDFVQGLLPLQQSPQLTSGSGIR
jgi:hypothetical protein